MRKYMTNKDYNLFLWYFSLIFFCLNKDKFTFENIKLSDEIKSSKLYNISSLPPLCYKIYSIYYICDLENINLYFYRFLIR